MAMTLLLARDTGTGYHLRAWVDNTQTLGDGSPDPVYVVEQAYAYKDPADARTVAQYLAVVRQEFKALCQQRLTQLQTLAGTALPGEGQTF